MFRVKSYVGILRGIFKRCDAYFYYECSNPHAIHLSRTVSYYLQYIERSSTIRLCPKNWTGAAFRYSMIAVRFPIYHVDVHGTVQHMYLVIRGIDGLNSIGQI